MLTFSKILRPSVFELNSSSSSKRLSIACIKISRLRSSTKCKKASSVPDSPTLMKNLPLKTFPSSSSADS